MENPEEILHSLEEFSKMKPKDIPRELEEYLCYVAKTGNPVYQWPTIKSLFREKLINVITEFYESCPAVDIPPCPNVDMFNYDLMKNFILEKLDTFSSAPFTVQRICELLTTPRKEYNRIDKYMRALEKNILVVSTTEPGRRSEHGESIMNGIEMEHMPEASHSSHDINVEEMDEAPTWPRQVVPVMFENNEHEIHAKQDAEQSSVIQESFETELKLSDIPSSSTAIDTEEKNQQETVITCTNVEGLEQSYVSEEIVKSQITDQEENTDEDKNTNNPEITTVETIDQHEQDNGAKIVENLVTEAVSAEDINNTIVPKDVPQTEIQPEIAIEDQILATVTSTESKEPADTHVVSPNASDDPESIPAALEQSGIENISPENSSQAPEELQVEVSSETEKTQIVPELSPVEVSEESKECEVSESSCDVDLKQPPCEEITPPQQEDAKPNIDESVNHSPVEVPEAENIVDDSTTPKEDTTEKIVELSSAEPTPALSDAPDVQASEGAENNTSTPMDVDISDADKVEITEQSTSENTVL